MIYNNKKYVSNKNLSITKIKTNKKIDLKKYLNIDSLKSKITEKTYNKTMCNTILDIKKKLKSVDKSNTILRSQLKLFLKTKTKSNNKIKREKSTMTEENNNIQNNIIITKLFNDLKQNVNKYENISKYYFNNIFPDNEFEACNRDKNIFVIKLLELSNKIVKSQFLNNKVKITDKNEYIVHTNNNSNINNLNKKSFLNNLSGINNKENAVYNCKLNKVINNINFNKFN